MKASEKLKQPKKDKNGMMPRRGGTLKKKTGKGVTKSK